MLAGPADLAQPPPARTTRDLNACRIGAAVASGPKKHRARSRKRMRMGVPAEMDSLGHRKQDRVQRGIADADKVARTGSRDEAVRNTPPAGAWNDVSGD